MPKFSAGFRFSPYGQKFNPGVKYWVRVGQEVASRFPDSTPEAIWIVSVLHGQGTLLSFPGTCNEPGIFFSKEDENQIALDLFDRLGFRIWLQVEPGDAKVETLFNLILERYKYHSCVVGVGVDVEWHHSSLAPEGETVNDDVAVGWLRAVRRHGEQYKMFLKHWEANKLPPTLREGLLFVDDSQMFDSLDQMLIEFTEWGEHFYPAPVAFQIGYPADIKWWGGYQDPVLVIGASIRKVVPNVAGLYWVNFTALDVFPP